jgi:hypothetical protein
MTTPDPDQSGPIKYFAFVKRRAGMPATEFHDYWEHQHAKHLAETPEISRHIRRYELHHRIDDGGRERNEVEVDDGGFDGVSILWFDNLEELHAMAEEPKLKEWSDADVAKFRDPFVASVVTHVGNVIVEPAGGAPEAGMSLICILRHNAAYTLPDFHEHWLLHHGALFQDIPELHDPLLGYEQNHGVDLPDAQFDGVTQQWFESLEAWTKSLEAPAHRDVVEPDVASFLDLESIYFVLGGRPTVMIG